MSTFQIGLPAGYPWVFMVASLTPFLTFWQSTRVTKGRKLSGIKYPQMYATKEEEQKNAEARKYNCTQRAHQNTLENLPQFLLALFLAGLRAPRMATVAGFVFLVGRVIYTLGYSSGEPKQRMAGSIVGYLGFLPLLIGSVFTSYKFLEQTNFHF